MKLEILYVDFQYSELLVVNVNIRLQLQFLDVFIYIFMYNNLLPTLQKLKLFSSSIMLVRYYEIGTYRKNYVGFLFSFLRNSGFFSAHSRRFVNSFGHFIRLWRKDICTNCF